MRRCDLNRANSLLYGTSDGDSHRQNKSAHEAQEISSQRPSGARILFPPFPGFRFAPPGAILAASLWDANMIEANWIHG